MGNRKANKLMVGWEGNQGVPTPKYKKGQMPGGEEEQGNSCFGTLLEKSWNWDMQIEIRKS